jgi:hypothetical protein
MNNRSFTDFVIGAAAWISLLGFYAIVAGVEEPGAVRRVGGDDDRWQLPPARRAHTPENLCRHCSGSGACDGCRPTACRICRGSGLQPHDQSLVQRLDAMWGEPA